MNIDSYCILNELQAAAYEDDDDRHHHLHFANNQLIHNNTDNNSLPFPVPVDSLGFRLTYKLKPYLIWIQGHLWHQTLKI